MGSCLNKNFLWWDVVFLSNFQNYSNVQPGLEPLTNGVESVQLHEPSFSLSFHLSIYKISKNNTFVIGKFKELNAMVDIQLLNIICHVANNQ